MTQQRASFRSAANIRRIVQAALFYARKQREAREAAQAATTPSQPPAAP
jgi:hypothetical protein